MDTYGDNPEAEPLRTKPPIAPKPKKVSKPENSPPTRRTYPRKSTTSSRADDDLYAEQTTPIARGHSSADIGHHQAAAGVLGSHLTGENDQSYRQPSVMDYGEQPKHPSPTGKLAWIGFGLSVFALTCMCISFASPYWLQQWPLSFSTFENMGLWEVCFHNYMHHRDDLQEIYNGCFWVFDSSEKYSKLRDWLLPPWFLACQVMCVAILLVEISVVVVTALVFLHMCPMMNHEYHQIFSMFISGAMMFLCTMTSIIVAILFGVQIQDRNWMPRPDWNFLSWGFGFLVISGMMALASGFLLFAAAWRSYNKLLRLQDDYFKQAMDMSQMYPTSQSQASYGAGYSDKPSYTSQPSYDQGGYRDKPSYTSQPSYDQEYRDKPVEKQDVRPSYGQSQSSYGEPEKAGYRGQQSYDGGQYGRPGDGQKGYSQGSYNGNRSREAGYDGNQSYDSTQGYDQGGYGQGGYDQGGYGQGGYGQGQGYNQYGPRA